MRAKPHRNELRGVPKVGKNEQIRMDLTKFFSQGGGICLATYCKYKVCQLEFLVSKNAKWDNNENFSVTGNCQQRGGAKWPKQKTKFFHVFAFFMIKYWARFTMSMETWTKCQNMLWITWKKHEMLMKSKTLCHKKTCFSVCIVQNVWADLLYQLLCSYKMYQKVSCPFHLIWI